MGDVKDDLGLEPVSRLIRSEPACMALIRLVDQYPGQVTIAAIGPLTNFALAIRIDPTFSSKIKELVIMGGDSEGVYGLKVCCLPEILE